jgi:glycosyltransferase involved in cell wall biosynthesis
MSDLPLVSIVVPVWNGERYLRQSLNSIVAQTYPRTEVLVMDDASTDGTPGIIGSYAGRIKGVRQPSTRGQFGNVNVGIGLAQGDYIAVYHADDVYDPRIVEREVEFLERNPEAGAVFCLDIFVDGDGREYQRLVLPPEVRGGRPLAYPTLFNAMLTYKNRFLCCPTSLVRAAVYRDVGRYRDAEFKDSSDQEMWLRIGRKYPIGILEEYLIRYRHTPHSVGRRYQYLRTDVELHFVILDSYLRSGDRPIATPEALAAHEAHRAEDGLMCAVSQYILDRRVEARRTLAGVRPGAIAASPRVQRGRLLLLWLVLQMVVRVPRMKPVAHLFQRRWHGHGGAAQAPLVERRPPVSA